MKDKLEFLKTSLLKALAYTLCISLLSFQAPNTGLPPKRAHHALIYDEANKCIVMTAGSTPLTEDSFAFFNDIWCFDGKQWKQSGESGDKRSGIRLAYDTKRKATYSIGGYAGKGGSFSDLRVLEAGQWKTVSELPGIKVAEAGFVYDEYRDRLVVFGCGMVNEDTWEWDGKSWSRFNGAGPEGRSAFAMVYDSKRKKTVLYGGSNKGQKYLDTWEYDATGWKKLEVQGPGVRLSPGFTYDSKRGIMILFGGAISPGMSGETWGWDGTAWTKLAETGPAKRAMGYMAYDKDRDRTVLFGGRLGWPNDANDTWEWDGKQWTEIKIQ
jgi:hypothetical protein